MHSIFGSPLYGMIISGDVTNLLEYETERQRSVVPMMVATDLLNRLFSTSSSLPTAARTAGLLAVNAAIPLKVMFLLVRECRIMFI